MYLIRNTMYAKPGRGGDLIAKLKAAVPHFETMGIARARVLSDAVATTWTISMELEVESVSTYFDILEGRTDASGLREAMSGYTELVTSGKREVFRIA